MGKDSRTRLGRTVVVIFLHRYRRNTKINPLTHFRKSFSNNNNMPSVTEETFERAFYDAKPTVMKAKRKLSLGEHYLVCHFVLAEVAKGEEHHTKLLSVALVFLLVLSAFFDVWCIGLPLCFGLSWYTLGIWEKSRRHRQSARACTRVLRSPVAMDVGKLCEDTVNDLAFSVDRKIFVKWAAILVPEAEA
jgi:hypothetical protein